MEYFVCRIGGEIYATKEEQKKCEAFHEKNLTEKSTEEKLNSHNVTVHICKDCNNPFVLTGNEKEWFVNKGMNIPIRCTSCRQKRKPNQK